MSTIVVEPAVSIIVRHSTTCRNADEGESYRKCICRKSARVYNPNPIAVVFAGKTVPSQGRIKIKTGTRAWEKAETWVNTNLQTFRDDNDPVKRELKALKAKAEAKTVSIERAVALFLASKKAERISEKRVQRYLPLLGDVDPDTFQVRRTRRNSEGRLFKWLKTQVPRPVYVSDLKPDLVEAFRNTWDFGSDLTDFGTFGDLKRFFNYCLGKGWIESHPMAGMKPPKVKRGSRTTAFSDAQYDSILAAIHRRFPAQIESLEDQQAHDDAHRVLAFIELMRWGGLALGDAVRFKLDSMKGNGQITYYRNKTKRRAQPRLVPHVVGLLKTTVPIDGDLNQPFYDKTVDGDTNTGYWSAELKSVFADAGIESVKTDIREREPHSHMLRDTFAINQLRTQYELGQVNHQTIADALGDTVAIFLKHYAPWIAEFEQAHQESQARITEAQATKLAQKQATNGKVTSIGGRQ